MTPAKADVQRKCIEQVVWAEARGESKRGQAAVAHVVINRHKKSGKSPCQVVKEQGQFVLGRPPAWFKITIPSRDPTGGATHFRTKDMPMWLGLRKLIRIGGHSFYGK
jgi:spore germination cell wall hydrolase CwlJ-like protein